MLTTKQIDQLRCIAHVIKRGKRVNLIKLGLNLIGTGNFSKVYSLRRFGLPGYVLKVGGASGFGGTYFDPGENRYKPGKDGYPAFIKMCQEHPDCENLPKVLHHESSPSSTMHWTVIEKLEGMRNALSHKTVRRMGSYLDVLMYSTFKCAEHRDTVALLPCKLRKALRSLNALISMGYNNDMHDGNFMLRGDIVVITDPLGHAN